MEELVVGTAGNDLLRLEDSVTFTWMPDPGNSYTQTNSFLVVDESYQWIYPTVTYSAPSTASGSVTFTGVASSEPFVGGATWMDFLFSNRMGVDLASLGAVNEWSWDPVTGVLQANAAGTWDNWIGAFFSTDQAWIATAHWSGSTDDHESGHWSLADDPHDALVFAGAGNDTIYAGQGTQTLSGEDGDDVIYAGRGEQIVFGGAGNDALHGGRGWQTLDGGAGDDTIWAGSGPQIAMGGAGKDLIWGGAGPDTLFGGDGNDTLWAGSGDQFLDGGAGADVLHAGVGNATITGGAGRDVFEFAAGVAGHDVITDFRVGQDVVRIALGLNGLAIGRAADIAGHLSAGGGAGAVLDLGAGTTVTFTGVSLHSLTAQLSTVFKIA